EINTALARHPQVVSAHTTVVEARLVSYVTTTRPVPTDQLVEHLRSVLPAEMVPAVIITVPSFPLTPNGKVDTAALPLPGTERPHLSTRHVPPRGRTEQWLAGLFSRILGIDGIGAGDDFFALGGHSLLVAQATAHIRQAFDIHLPLRQIFDTPTITALAHAIDRHDASTEHPIPAVRARERTELDLPLSYSQEMIWFLSELSPHSVAYNVALAVRWRGRLDPEALARALTAIIARHEITYSSFHVEGGRPLQRVGRPWTVELPVLDLRALSSPQRQQRLDSLLAELNVPFEVDREPLLRWRLAMLADDEYVMLQVEHHFVHDGWSIALFLAELKAIYLAFSEGRPHDLRPLEVHYGDFTLWQRQLVEDGHVAHQLAYWREQLSGGAVPALNLLGERPRAAEPSVRGAVERLYLAPRLCDRLTSLGRQHGTTLFATLYTVFAITCRAFSDTDDVVIGSSSANRPLRALEPVLGMMVNPLVLRLDVGGNPSFAHLLERARETVLGAFDHAEYPFELLVRELAPARDVRANPLFQVSFAFHDTPLPTLEFPGLVGRVEYLAGESAKFDLNVTGIREPADPIDGREGGYVLEWEYSTDLYRAGEIRRLIRAYQTILDQITKRPDASVGELVAEVHRLDRQRAAVVRANPGATRRKPISSTLS
ncbi:condensation domain-containing protein, partial [Nonomuraea sp. NPDC003804]|uniref:condensation domain-containing protein n=1 Tax=Nonomuraea sp. NPDC003804 TaxID=3154547 RepID=UPI0033A57EF1